MKTLYSICVAILCSSIASAQEQKFAIQWETVIPATDFRLRSIKGISVLPTLSGGCVIACLPSNNIPALTKISASGNVEWLRMRYSDEETIPKTTANFSGTGIKLTEHATDYSIISFQQNNNPIEILSNISSLSIKKMNNTSVESVPSTAPQDVLINASALTETPDGSILCAGKRYEDGKLIPLVYRTNEFSNIISYNTLPPTLLSRDFSPVSITLMNSTNLVMLIANNSSLLVNNNCFEVRFINSALQQIGQAIITPQQLGEKNASIYAVQLLAEKESILVLGNLVYSANSIKPFIMRISSQGIVTHYKIIDKNAHAISGCVTQNGSIILCGSTLSNSKKSDSDYLLSVIDNQLNKTDVFMWGSSQEEVLYSAALSENGSIYLTGSCNNNLYAANINYHESALNNDALATDMIRLSIAPHPVNSKSTILMQCKVPVRDVTIYISDMMGRRIETLYSGALEPNEYSFSPRASFLSEGLYIFTVSSNEGVITKPFTVVR